MKITIDGQEYDVISANAEIEDNVFEVVSIEAMRRIRENGKRKYHVSDERHNVVRSNGVTRTLVEFEFKSETDSTPDMVEMMAKIKAVIESYTV
jgi:hypothetical protein